MEAKHIINILSSHSNALNKIVVCESYDDAIDTLNSLGFETKARIHRTNLFHTKDENHYALLKKPATLSEVKEAMKDK